MSPIEIAGGLKVKLFADETTAPVLDPGRGRTKKGQIWTYARDDRPWEAPHRLPSSIALHWTAKPGRPIEHLAGFCGVLQVDGYAGYERLGRQGAVKLAPRPIARDARQSSCGSDPLSINLLCHV